MLLLFLLSCTTIEEEATCGSICASAQLPQGWYAAEANAIKSYPGSTDCRCTFSGPGQP